MAWEDDDMIYDGLRWPNMTTRQQNTVSIQFGTVNVISKIKDHSESFSDFKDRSSGIFCLLAGNLKGLPLDRRQTTSLRTVHALHS